MKNSLYKYIQKVRFQKANYNLINSFSIFAIIYFFFLSLLGGAEFIFHFGQSIRLAIFEFLAFTLGGSLSFLGIRWVIQSRALLGNYSNSEIAKWIGEQNPEIADRLLNCIQL